jgi:hypothetical protein
VLPLRTRMRHRLKYVVRHRLPQVHRMRHRLVWPSRGRRGDVRLVCLTHRSSAPRQQHTSPLRLAASSAPREFKASRRWRSNQGVPTTAVEHLSAPREFKASRPSAHRPVHYSPPSPGPAYARSLPHSPGPHCRLSSAAPQAMRPLGNGAGPCGPAGSRGAHGPSRGTSAPHGKGITGTGTGRVRLRCSCASVAQRLLRRRLGRWPHQAADREHPARENRALGSREQAAPAL